MKHLELANKDKMPILGLGTFLSERGEVYGAVSEAIKMGYRHIDCAHIYENEAEIGLAIKDCISDGLVKRQDLWITSKLWNSSHGKDNVSIGLKRTLDDLQLKYLDLYLIHWPVSLKPGVKFPENASDFLSPDDSPIEDTWKGMEEVLEQGLAKHIGLSNFSIKKIKKIQSTCRHKPEVLQVELHPLLQQPKLLEFCNKNNITTTAYAPLGSKNRQNSLKSKNIPDFLVDPSIIQIAKKHQATPAQIVLAWACMRGTALIPKSVNNERLSQNLKAAEIELSGAEMDVINGMDRNFRFITGKLWTIPGSPYSLEDLWDE